MPEYKLCYFNARGLGELARLLFAEAGVEYKDVRYNSEEWPKQKPTMQFGQMPVLFVDGVQIAHSRAIARFLTREFKLDGGSSLQSALIDTWMEVLFETFQNLPFREQDPTAKAEKLATVMKDNIGPKLEKLQEQSSSTPGPYIFKDFTAADIIVYAITDFLVKSFKVDLICYQGITKLRDAVSQRPNIKKWIEARPDTEN
uniref:glutathione transferase n=1 Tax=Phallusia mammillata TaxID=59560 RepID=A0A6F9DK42_9ASCI|nr:glutathione S-transferase 1 [Phallusia mammillata]